MYKASVLEVIIGPVRSNYLPSPGYIGSSTALACSRIAAVPRDPHYVRWHLV